MKRKVLKILIIIIAIIATFFSSFFIAIKLLDVTGNEKESMQNVTENKAIEEIEEESINNIEANSFE